MTTLKTMLILSASLLTSAFACDDLEPTLSPEAYKEGSVLLQRTISLEEIDSIIEEDLTPPESTKPQVLLSSPPIPSLLQKIFPPLTIQQIQQKLLRKGISLDNLEGGFVLMFDPSGQLINSKSCQRTQILHGLLYGSPDAYLVQGLSLQSQQNYLRAFDYFLIAASGNSGVSQATCGGTSSELAFYNMFQLLSAKGFKDSLGRIVHSDRFDKYVAEDYKKFTTPVPILQKQLESLLATVKKQSHKQTEIVPSISTPRHSILSLLSPRSTPLTHTQSHLGLEQRKEETPTTSSKEVKSVRTSLAALLSPRGHKKEDKKKI